MRRRQSSVSAERAQELWNKRTVAGDSVTMQCQLVTPMYGGGVNAGKVDEAMPIRASGIRGQLRFWWRLLYGAGRSSDEVFPKECALWGGIASCGPTASKVVLRVQSGPANGHLTRKSSLNVPRYALILEPGDDPDLLQEGYGFKVLIRFHGSAEEEQKQQVIKCLRWWASFGGVGARTRRGLGAIRANSDDADLRAVTSAEVEGLGGRIATGQQMDALQAWDRAVCALQSFRQAPPGARQVGSSPNRPGRSNWPEGDTIRRAVGGSAIGHEPRVDVNRFPRAGFGLPIVFHFKDRGDPPDVTLSPSAEGTDRMASPLILRPYFDGERYRPMAMLLPGWREYASVRVALHETKGGRPVPIADGARTTWPSNPAEGKQLASQLKPMQGEPDPLTAFMRYFDERVNSKARRGRR